MLYKKNKLKEISFPIGGIGTGSIGLAGNGCLVDWEIFNRPNKGSINKNTNFAIRAEYPNGKIVTKVLRGDEQKDFSGSYSCCNNKDHSKGFGFGSKADTMCGYPHFRDLEFEGRFPIAKLSFRDEDFPGKVVLTAFNPFIPLDCDNSSIPAAFFDVSIENGCTDVKYTVVFSVTNPFEASLNERIEHEDYTAILMKCADKSLEDKEYGELTVAVDRPNGIVQEYWYRGGWYDNVTTYWHELTTDDLHSRKYETAGENDTSSVGYTMTLDAGETEHLHFVLSWNIPNNYCYWSPYKDEEGKDVLWKNYYAVMFRDSIASCFYAMDNWDMLYGKTTDFCNTLHNATLDAAVIDAVSSTLSVLKSPTVLRLEDGTFYGWEGVSVDSGSCMGTCTHVWSYTYALCFLFPELERSIRNVEFKYDVFESGSMQFRTELPPGREMKPYRGCLDGQMATIIKTYREWKVSGDDNWLKEHWNTVKKLIEFAWSPQNEDEWDRDHDGVLEGRQHHTLDMELFGPSSWLEGMYLAALKAAAEMAEYLGDLEKQREYLDLFKKGFSWTKENLFNGQYFIQKIDIKNKEYTEHFHCPNYWNDEKHQIQYQIGEGCEIDQMLAQWHANICGLGDIFDTKQRKTALKSMLKYNFKESMRDFANMWRVFALNDEKGSVMCAWPDDVEKPIIPIPYCDECMTGFEYAFAGLLVSEGFGEEGLRVIKAVRDRYDGEKRNPWNEIECGSNYARAMASFALLPIYSGFEFHMSKKHVGFSPKVDGDFRCLWSLGTGWGNFIRENSVFKIAIKGGWLELESVRIGNVGKIQCVMVDGKKIDFNQEGELIKFETVKVEDKLVLHSTII